MNTKTTIAPEIHTGPTNYGPTSPDLAHAVEVTCTAVYDLDDSSEWEAEDGRRFSFDHATGWLGTSATPWTEVAL